MIGEANPKYGQQGKGGYGGHHEPDADDIRKHRGRYMAGWGMLLALLLLIAALWLVSDLNIRITWANPAPIHYPTPLGPDQLNPKANISGFWDFDPRMGDILQPGLKQTLRVRLTPDLLKLEGLVPLQILLIAGIIALAAGLGRWRYWRRRWPLPLRVGGALLAVVVAFLILFRGTSASVVIDVLPGSLALDLAPIPNQVYSPQATPIPVHVTVIPTAPVTVSAAGDCVMAPSAAGEPAVLVKGAGNCVVSAHEDAGKGYQPPPDATRAFSIDKAKLVASWPQPAPIVEGTPLGPAQLNAVSTPAAPPTYNPAAGTLLPAGSHVLSANFVPAPADAANYTGASVTTTLLVQPGPTPIPTVKPQTIDFPPISDKVLGDPAFTIAATASSKLSVGLASDTPGICSVPPNSHDSAAVTLLAPGTCTLTASQPGDGGNWAKADPVSRSFEVKQRTPPPTPIEVDWRPKSICVGGRLTAADQLNATARDGTAKLPPNYEPQVGTQMNTPGTQTLKVTFYPLDATKNITTTTTRDIMVNPDCIIQAEFLKNGSFEQGFRVLKPATTVGNFWQPYNNGGANVEYGYYDDTVWPGSPYTVVFDGQHAQEIEIGTAIAPHQYSASTPNRAAGIGQTVTGLIPGSSYRLTLHGVIRVSEGDPDTDNGAYVAQWGIDPTGKGDPNAVTRWNDIPWTHVSYERSPDAPQAYQTEITAPGSTVTLYIRLLKAPDKGNVELNLDLDGLSLFGPKRVQ